MKAKRMTTMNENEVLVYVKFLYKEDDENYCYELYFSTTPDIVWGDDWDVPSPASNTDCTPDKSTCSSISVIKSPYKLKTIEEIQCYCVEYAIYGIIALSWIDIETLDEYPENGRMVLHFGDEKEKVKNILSKFGISIQS